MCPEKNEGKKGKKKSSVFMQNHNRLSHIIYRKNSLIHSFKLVLKRECNQTQSILMGISAPCQ